MTYLNDFAFGKRGFLVLLVLLFENFCLAQTTKCTYLVGNTSQTVKLKPTIDIGFYSGEITPIQFSSSKGLMLKCNFELKNRKLYASVTSYHYSFYSGGRAYNTGSNNSAFWTNSIIEISKKIRKGDSLVIKKITAKISDSDTTILLNQMPDIEIENLTLVFSESAHIHTPGETLFIKNVNSISTFKKLLDLYASDYRIGVSMNMRDVSCENKSKICKKRYQYKTGSHIDYDFTFIQNNKGVISKVYDNLKRKEYTMKQWENLMRNVK